MNTGVCWDEYLFGANDCSISWYKELFATIYPILCLYDTHVSLLCNNINPCEVLHIGSYDIVRGWYKYTWCSCTHQYAGYNIEGCW